MRALTSIVIPVRNDADALGRTLGHLAGLDGISGAEVIVGASGDVEGTTQVARGRARMVWPEGSTRARLMNAAAREARGDVLFFLHADSLPPANALPLIEAALGDRRVVGGAFEHRFAEPGWSLRVINWINRVRYRLTGNYYGDQGIFVRAAVFREMGGFPDRRLMEDLVFTQRLRRHGRRVLIPTPLVTSGRRFLARGPWRTFSMIVWLLLLHTLRVDTERYAERWRGPADRSPGSPWPHARPVMMTCRDVVDLLVEYLDATLDATAHEDLERHLEGCGPCVAYLNTYRRTRSLVGSVHATEMPDEMKRRLRDFLLKRLGDTG